MLNELINGIRGKLLIYSLSEPLGNAQSMKAVINAGSGNLTINKTTTGKEIASGSLQYVKKQGLPTRSLTLKNGKAALILRANGPGLPWLRLPWAACNGATDWYVRLNPSVLSDINAHSDGGNLKLDLTGMKISNLKADTGGGNVSVVLPDKSANLKADVGTGGGNVDVSVGRGYTGINSVSAQSGAGNVKVHVPKGIAVRVYAASGLGKVIVDPKFIKSDNNTYQTPDFDKATDKLDCTVKSGAGNVTVDTV